MYIGSLYASQVSAEVFDANDNLITGRQLQWSSSDPTRLTVTPSSSTATATLVATGTPSSGVQVHVTVVGTSVSSTLTVPTALVPIASVTATPSTFTIGINRSQALAITAFDASGNVVGSAGGNPLGGRRPTFIVADSRVATVDVSGVVTGGRQGTTAIDVSFAGAPPARVNVTVVPPGQTGIAVEYVEVTPANVALLEGDAVTLTAITRDAAGTALTNRSISWSTSASDVSLSSTSGTTTTVRAVRAGSVVVQASSEGKAGQSRVTITRPPRPPSSAVTGLESVPSRATPTLSVRARSGATVSGRFRVIVAGGNAAGHVFTVGISDASIGSVAPKGSNTTNGGGLGDFEVTLAPGARSGDQADVTVTVGGRQLTWRLSVN